MNKGNENKFVKNSINMVNLTKKKTLAYTLWKTKLKVILIIRFYKISHGGE